MPKDHPLRGFCDPLMHGHRLGNSLPLERIKEYLVPEPVDFELFEWKLVAEVPQLGSDGHPVQVFECRAPARFYKVVALPSKNSVGDCQMGFELHTGSATGIGDWVAGTALLIAHGMLKQEQSEETVH